MVHRCRVDMAADPRGLSSNTPNVTSTAESHATVLIFIGTGRRKALLIGINYFNTSSALRGCINDAHNVQKFLIGK